MQAVAVWDTYVKKADGSYLHFDIIVPETEQNADTIFAYGREYLMAVNEAGGRLETEECQFCHIETPGQEITDAVTTKGYYILEMEDIPARLPENPTRRELILHLRAHYPAYRFADFKGKSLLEIQEIFAGF